MPPPPYHPPLLFTLQENIAVQTITLVTLFDPEKRFQSRRGYFSLRSVKSRVRGDAISRDRLSVQGSSQRALISPACLAR